jgi:hypothetical protein
MPVITDNTDTIDRGGSSSGTSTNVPLTRFVPYQIAGLVLMSACTSNECRTWPVDCCFSVPVFANPAAANSMIQNDFSAFLLSFPTYVTGGNTSAIWSIQKWVNGAWVQQSIITGSTYGSYYAFESLAIDSYTGVVIQWLNIFNVFGEGCYRIACNYLSSDVPGCVASEVFWLREFSCQRAHGTVRFDSYLFDGQIAHIDIDGFMCNLCEIKWEDQVRLPGFFGRENSEREDRKIELIDGKQYNTRSELINKFKLRSGLWPKWVHDRLKSYGCMSDELRVTDYNYNNSDYLIKRKLIVADGNYQPTYNIGSRMAIVECDFAEGYQNVIRTLCCPVVR